MKRFTATEKWGKPWFRKLSPALKVFWQFLCDHVDAAGVWEPDFELASFHIGAPVSEADMAAFGDRSKKLESGKFWLTGFVEFQYGKLSKDCKAHIPVIRTLEKHGLFIAYAKGIHTLKETEEEKETETEEGSAEGRDESAKPSAPSKPAKPPAVKPKWTREAGWENISVEQKTEWRMAYPACDVDRQLLAMTVWLKANPAKAVKSNWLAFAAKWLQRSQDRGGDMMAGFTGSAPQTPARAPDAAWLEFVATMPEAWRLKNPNPTPANVMPYVREDFEKWLEGES